MKILPRDENYKLCRPVIKETSIYCYNKEDGCIADTLTNGWPKTDEEKATVFGAKRETIYDYQCEFCKKLFVTYPLGHLRACSAHFDGTTRYAASKQRVQAPVLKVNPWLDCCIKNNKLLDPLRTRVSLERVERDHEVRCGKRGYRVTEEHRMQERSDLCYWLGFDSWEEA